MGVFESADGGGSVGWGVEDMAVVDNCDDAVFEEVETGDIDRDIDVIWAEKTTIAVADGD